MKNKILMYHAIEDAGNYEKGADLYCVSEARFREQLEVVADKLKHDHKSDILITFDDGHITNYQYAFPLLLEMHLNAYFFIIPPKVGEPHYMNWERIRDLKARGMIIGSHGMTHRILTELNEKELGYELKESKKILEGHLKKSVDYFSVPRGFYNEKVIRMAREAGYKAVFTSNPKDADGFKFGRIPVMAGWSLEYFTRVLNRGLSVKDKTKQMIKNSSKRILGAANYNRLRSMILKK